MTDFLRDHLRQAPVLAARAPWTLPDQALRFDSVDQIARVVAESGNRYFDPATQAAHGHRLENGLYANRFFIISHPDSAGRPTYTVNWASREPGGTRISVERFDDVLTDRTAAHALASKAFREVESAFSPALEAVRPTHKPDEVETPDLLAALQNSIDRHRVAQQHPTAPR